MELLVLYRNGVDVQTWAIYSDREQADEAFDANQDTSLEEISRIEITRTANVLFFVE